MRSLDIPLSMIMAVSLLLRDQPSLSMGLKPSKGGSDTLQSLGGGLGGLRPASCGASSMAEGAMVVVKREMGMGMRQVQDQGVISYRGRRCGVCAWLARLVLRMRGMATAVW